MNLFSTACSSTINEATCLVVKSNLVIGLLGLLTITSIALMVIAVMESRK